MESIRFIKKVEIEGLWNRHDIEWNLNEDVNILAGINGSGKTTILDLIAGTIGANIDEVTAKMANSVKITFNNDQFIAYTKIEGTIKNLIQKAKSDKYISDYISELKQREGRDFKKIYAVEEAKYNFQNKIIDLENFATVLDADVVSTFDKQLKDPEAVSKVLEEAVKTELDLQIYFLQKQYLEYQINIGKKAIEALSSDKITFEEQQKINYKKNLFLNTIDELFQQTGKQVDRNKNKLVFTKDKQVLSAYSLSSGEKQLVIILLKALVQEEKNIVMFLDEPEISLHTDWQEKLIENIRNLNNNAQIIIATHSPSIVLDGWQDKVFEVSEITLKPKMNEV